MKTLATLSFILFLIVVGYLGYDFCVQSNGTLTQQTLVDLPPGSSFGSLLRNLQAKGIDIPNLEAKIAAKFFKFDHKIKAGEYMLSPPLSSLQILKALSTGIGIQRNLLVKEGFNRWDISEMWKTLDAHFSLQAYNEVLADPSLLEKMKIPGASEILGLNGVKLANGEPIKSKFRSLEGYLFPETYSFQKYDSMKKIVEEMLLQFDIRARPILERHPWAKSPLGLYRLLTLASIIEKESGNGDEQPLVSSVFWNRLAKKMRLQSDPTTIYGLLPNFDGNLKRIHLQTFSLFNTYTIPELPVGPICNPGEKALRAAVQPAASQFLYFVGRGDNTHIFAETYEAHNKNVRTFQLHR